jgi:hypothetical protein
VFQSFLTIRFVLVESNIGWIPTALEQLDDMFLRYRWYTKAVELVPTMPSRVFHTNFWATFMKDRIGVELRHHMNLDHIMWSTDYPHTGSEWPNSRAQIESLLRGLPRAEVKLLHDNVKALLQAGMPDRVPAGLAGRPSAAQRSGRPPPRAGGSARARSRRRPDPAPRGDEEEREAVGHRELAVVQDRQQSIGAVSHPVSERHEPAAEEGGRRGEESDHHEDAADGLDRARGGGRMAGFRRGWFQENRRASASRATGKESLSRSERA